MPREKRQTRAIPLWIRLREQPARMLMQPAQMMPPMQQPARYMKISKWNGSGVDYFDLPGQEETALNNGSKSNPVISADLFGDWREELVVRTADNKSLRVYMTDIPTDYRFHTLMSDIVYRMGVLCENVCYNQPPEVGFVLSSDLGRFWPVRNVRDPQAPRDRNASRDLNGRLGGTNPQELNEITVYKNIADKYVLDARNVYDSYEWTINGKVAGREKTLTLRQSDYGYDKPVSVHIKAVQRGQVFEGDGTVTFSSQDGRRGYWSERDAQRTGRWEF